jgi:hypothetical protein
MAFNKEIQRRKQITPKRTPSKPTNIHPSQFGLPFQQTKLTLQNPLRNESQNVITKKIAPPKMTTAVKIIVRTAKPSLNRFKTFFNLEFMYPIFLLWLF